MPLNTLHGGGHIDTPFPESPMAPRRAPKRIDTPDPVHETPPPTGPPPEPEYWQVGLRGNPYFLGRESTLQKIHAHFVAAPLCHLRGPLGSGTTQTALAYAFRARGGYDAVFWINANAAVTFRLELSRCGDEIGLSGKEERPHFERVDAFLHWLETHERWLLIADDVTDPALVQTLLRLRPSGKILVTGHTTLEELTDYTLEHEPFSDDAAINLLHARSTQSGTKNGATLVANFHGSALPLHLAAACCHTEGVPLSTYEQGIESKFAALSAHSEADRPQALVQIAVEQSLAFLSNQNPAALELMALCAHLDPDDIPLVTLYDGAPFLPKRLSACVTDPPALNQALTLLFRLGLVQFSRNSISIHPLVQRATSQLVGFDQRMAWIRTALRVVLEAFPIESKYTHPIPACSMLIPHALSVCELSEKTETLREGTGALLNQIGLYLHACGELDTARTCFERSIAQAEKLYRSDVHPTIAARVNSLGVVLQDQKHYVEARDCYERAFQLCEAIYGPACDAAMGPAHRSMLTMPSRNLCLVYELMGDIPAARNAYEKAIEVFIDVYCWNHSQVAKSMNGLGELYLQEGEYGKAQQYFLKAIQAEENAEEGVLGASAHYTRNLAQSLMEMELIEEAKKYYEHALDYDREDFGPVHDTVATDLQGLARTHRARSRFEAAHRSLDEALAIWEALPQDTERAKARVWRQKGRCYLDASNDEAAIHCLRRAIEITTASTGPQSTALGPDLVYLGRALSRREHYGEAEEALLRALRLHETVPWLDEEGLSVLYGRLVRVFRAQSNFQKAAVFQEFALKDNERRFGMEADCVGTDAYSLGNLYIALGQLDDARFYLKKACNIYSNSRGEEDERTTRVRKKLAAVEERSTVKVTAEPPSESQSD